MVLLYEYRVYNLWCRSASKGRKNFFGGSVLSRGTLWPHPPLWVRVSFSFPPQTLLIGPYEVDTLDMMMMMMLNKLEEWMVLPYDYRVYNISWSHTVSLSFWLSRFCQGTNSTKSLSWWWRLHDKLYTLIQPLKREPLDYKRGCAQALNIQLLMKRG